MRSNRSLLALLLLLISLPLSAQDLSALYEEVSPGVVMIFTEEKSFELDEGTLKKTTAAGLGSGFLISERNILTAAHVVTVPDRILVEFTNGQVIPARVVFTQKSADLAMLELSTAPRDPKILKLADSDKVKIGNRVFVIGAPYGLGQSLSVGYVSGFKKEENGNNPFTIGEYIQTDAAINTGNSGGPMFNLQGEVIGIVSHIATQSGGFQGIGFAATSNLARSLMETTRLPWTGADVVPLTGELAEHFNLPQPEGLLVQRVAFSSPFGIKGIEGGDTVELVAGQELITGGDIILKFNDITFDMSDKTLNELAEFARKTDFSGGKFELTILRDGEVKVVGRRQ